MFRWFGACLALVLLAGCLLSPGEHFLQAAPAPTALELEPTNYVATLLDWKIPGGQVWLRTTDEGAFACDWEMDLEAVRALAPKGSARRSAEEVGFACSFNGVEFGRGVGLTGSIVSADGVPASGELVVGATVWALADRKAGAPVSQAEWTFLEPSIEALAWANLDGCAKLGREERPLDAWRPLWTTSAVGGRVVGNWSSPFEITGYGYGGGSSASEEAGPNNLNFEIGILGHQWTDIEGTLLLKPAMQDTISRPPGDEGGCTGVVHHEATPLPLDLVFEPWHGSSIDLSQEPVFNAWLEAV